MVLRLRTILGLVLLAGLSSGAGRQDHSSSPSAYEFFSGNVADLETDRVVVERAVLGKSRERRSFLILSETKIEGTLRKSVRVTVGFLASDQGDTAQRIIVRSEK